MKSVMLRKVGRHLVATDISSEEYLNTLIEGEVYRAQITKPRKLWFHRKYFALLNVAFDYWDPPKDLEFEARYGHVPEKNFDRFRKDIAILAGFFEAYYRVDGTVRVTAKSISFAAMDQDEFEDLYEKTMTVLISKIFGPDNEYYTREEIERVVNELVEFV